MQAAEKRSAEKMLDERLVFTTRPWGRHDGNPADPQTVVGVRVACQLCLSPSGKEALFALEDRRYALTGQVVAVGSKSQLQLYIRQRSRRSSSDDHRAWLNQAMKALKAAGNFTSKNEPTESTLTL